MRRLKGRKRRWWWEELLWKVCRHLGDSRGNHSHRMVPGKSYALVVSAQTRHEEMGASFDFMPYAQSRVVTQQENWER